jgi:hypothetical protein
VVAVFESKLDSAIAAEKVVDEGRQRRDLTDETAMPVLCSIPHLTFQLVVAGRSLIVSANLVYYQYLKVVCLG